jgi:hypothetical protein
MIPRDPNGARATAPAIRPGQALAPAFAGKGKYNRRPHHRRICSSTAWAQFDACRNEVRDDAFTAKAICLNVSDEEEREECFGDAKEERRDADRLCRDQRNARRSLCGELGEGRYDPDFDPADFDDPRNPGTPNPFFPLGVGSQWKYAGGDETIQIEVLDETKRIEGVDCLVVNDRVEEGGEVTEDTDDWYGLRKDGTIDYCGELSKELETFEDDDPEEPELVSIEGSFKAGRDGDKSGTLFQGAPAVGQVYRQEWSPGNAEDAARVLSTTYGYGADPELDEFVPQALADLLCAAHDCVVTGEFTPISPDGFERKYYARGIGLFLEVDPESGDIVQLVDCNVDPKCAALPTP